MKVPEIKILIADDHQMVREGIKSSLESFTDIRVVAEASNGKEVLERLETVGIDLILMDISMPVMDGIETAKRVLAAFPDISVLALSMHEDESHITHMLKAGAMGYVLKTVNPEDLTKAIHTVFKGETYFSKRVSDVMMTRFMSAKVKKTVLGFNQLTRREIEILRLIAEGLTNPEIAERLFLSTRTVDTHRRNLTQKLNVKNTAGLVKEAIKNELIEV